MGFPRSGLVWGSGHHDPASPSLEDALSPPSDAAWVLPGPPSVLVGGVTSYLGIKRSGACLGGPRPPLCLSPFAAGRYYPPSRLSVWLILWPIPGWGSIAAGHGYVTSSCRRTETSPAGGEQEPELGWAYKPPATVSPVRARRFSPLPPSRTWAQIRLWVRACYRVELSGRSERSSPG